MKTEHGYQLAMHLLEQAFAAYKDGKDEFEPGPFGYEHRTAMDELTADSKPQDEKEDEPVSDKATPEKPAAPAAPEKPAVAAHPAPSSAAAKKAARRS